MAIVGSNTTPDTYVSGSSLIQRWDINRHTVLAGDTITKVGYFGDDDANIDMNVYLVDAVSGDLIYTHNFLTMGGTDYIWFEDVVSVAIPAGYVGNEVFVVLERASGGSHNTRYDSGMSSGDVEYSAANITDPLALGGWINKANGPSFYMEVTAGAAGPTLTAPDTVTHGVATTATGSELSTVTGMTLEYGTVALSQSFALVGDDLDFTPDVGVPTAYGTGNAVDSLPLTPDHTSSGITPYQVTLDVTDGTASDSRNVTNVAAGAVQTFQVMAAGVNKTAGEGLGGSDLVVIEDNHQVTVPLVVDGVTLTIDPDTLDYSVTQAQLPAGSSITFDAVYYSPTEEQSSKIAVTITAPAADTPPTSPANQAVNVTEGNTAVGNTSTATGTAPMTYSKGGTDAASFNVNSTTGALTFITAPDYETKTSYSVTVVANNTFGTDSHIVTVTILNVIEETITAPTPANVGYGYGEAGVPHTDSGLLAWLATASVTGGGAVTNNLAAQVDPLVNATVITFSASDAANQTSTVTPTEAAPTAPVMPATATRNVAQPNQLMGVYVTSNTPDQAVTYTLTGTDAGLLSINGSTGAVTANSPTSVAGKSTYSFNVVATNVGGTDTTAVTVTIVAVVARNMTEWIEANGAGGQTNEAWLKYMLGAGASGKTFNDLMFDWLGILGYTGSLTERVAEWTEANLN